MRARFTLAVRHQCTAAIHDLLCQSPACSQQAEKNVDEIGRLYCCPAAPPEGISYCFPAALPAGILCSRTRKNSEEITNAESQPAERPANSKSQPRSAVTQSFLHLSLPLRLSILHAVADLIFRGLRNFFGERLKRLAEPLRRQALELF